MLDDKTCALLGDNEAAKLTHLSLFSGIGGLDLAANFKQGERARGAERDG